MIEISIVVLICGYLSMFALGVSVSNLLYIRALLKQKKEEREKK